MNLDLDKFGQRISLLLNENNMTQTQLAKKLGITEATVSRYISGLRFPYIEIAIDMSKIFKVSIEYLFGLTDERENINCKIIKNDIDFNANVFVKELFCLEQNQNLSKKQIDAIKKLMYANKDFILNVI